MSNVQTNWVLNLIDMITGPMRKAMKATNDMNDAVDAVQESVQLSAKETEEALKKEKKHRTELRNKIKEQEKAIKELEAQQDKTAPGEQWAKIKADIDRAKRAVDDYRDALEGAEDDIRDLTERADEFKRSQESWGNVATGANQAMEAVQKFGDAFDFAGDYKKMEANLQRMTGLTGESLDGIAEKVHVLSKVYNESGEEIARAANAYAKQMEIPFTDALALVEAGFKKGANLNGDMLDQMKEYGPQLKENGISAAQGIALMAKAGQEGVFSDKAIDAIKEAGLSLREMGKPQIDALKGIGLEAKDLAGKTAFEAAQMISKAMDGATVQARQMALTDIFKGAGEDAGMSFITGLGSVDMDINNIPSVSEAGEGIKTWLAEMESWFSSAFGNVVVFAQQFGGVAQFVGGMIPVVQALTKATWFQNIATKAATVGQQALNLAFKASPFGWVVLALGAITAAVTYCWNEFEGFRAFFYSLWETIKTIFNNILGLFKAIFSPIGEAITAIKEGRWGDAALAVAKMNPVGMAMRAGKYVADGGLTKGVGEAWKRGDEMGRSAFKKDKEEEKKTDVFNIDSPQFGTKLDGIVSDPNKDKKAKGGSGMEIGGSGGKGITMNLEINNHFSNIKSNMDVRQIANEVAGIITDRIRDTIIAA